MILSIGLPAVPRAPHFPPHINMERQHVCRFLLSSENACGYQKHVNRGHSEDILRSIHQKENKINVRRHWSGPLSQLLLLEPLQQLRLLALQPLGRCAARLD